MSGKLFGRATIRADGQHIRTHDGATLDLGGVKRTPRPGANDADGFTEEIVPGKIEFDLQLRAGVSIAALQAISDGVLTFECDTGQTYIMNHAYCAEPPSMGGEGKVKCVFQGPPAEEML
ncbi:MAG: phage tail tube protein [Reyranella sp.]|nr:phage tail tube protein [Reyranella sp.]